MKIIINNKVCDNSPACGGIDVCPTGALFWDDDLKKINFEESKCIGCGACVNACPVHAIMLAKDLTEASKIQTEIDNDPRKEADLFTDRYGADITRTQSVSANQAIKLAKEYNGLVILELYDEETLHCLVTSIPI